VTGPAPLGPPVEVTITRADLIRYAGAARDFAPQHWSDEYAAAAGLPGVIAQGMLMMAIAVRVVEEQYGPRTLIVACDARFTRPLAVPASGGAILAVSATVSPRNAPESGETVINLVGSSDGAVVLTGSCRVRCF
jgi:acyl dehydratase